MQFFVWLDLAILINECTVSCFGVSEIIWRNHINIYNSILNQLLLRRWCMMTISILCSFSVNYSDCRHQYIPLYTYFCFHVFVGFRNTRWVNKYLVYYMYIYLMPYAAKIHYRCESDYPLAYSKLKIHQSARFRICEIHSSENIRHNPRIIARRWSRQRKRYQT